MNPFRVSEGVDQIDMECHACKGRIPAGTLHPSAVLESGTLTLFPICNNQQCRQSVLDLLTNPEPRS